MEFGIFDHMDFSGVETLSEFYENRLKLAEVYDEIGIYSYHLAEHHATPLGMAPSPNVFLSAMAQRTTRLRFGPLVYCLPLYHPIRLLEEICMLDQMSGGRLEMGFGRGISPIELGYYGLDYEEGRSIYQETFELITQGLTQRTLTFKGDHFNVDQMPIPLAPIQKPHPPLWYGLANPAATSWPARQGLNVITNQPVERVLEMTTNYKKEWTDAGRDPDQLPRIGMTRYLVIAESKEAALQCARRAYPIWRKSFMALWDLHDRDPIGVHYPETFDGISESGQGIAGTPAQVGEEIVRQCTESGVNYFVCRFAFGDLTLDESSRSIRLFAEKIMPKLTGLV